MVQNGSESTNFSVVAGTESTNPADSHRAAFGCPIRFPCGDAIGGFT